MKKNISILLAVVMCISLLTGCKANELPLDYKKENTITTTNKVGNAADGFSSMLAVTNENVEGKTGAKVEDQSAAGLFDINKCEVLYAKDVHERLAPASLTKVLTALVALKYGNTEDIITCTSEVTNIDYDATKIGLKPGDRLTLNQALHALLINSANDAAIAIAEHIAGSVEAFSDMMNREALALGATNSHFINPHGLTNNDHYTTAYDLYLIMNAAIKYSTFNEIIQLTEYESVYNDSTGKEKSMSFKTTNLFLRGDYSAPERVTVIGGKTGTTNAAGNCLILVVKDAGGNPYVGVILRASQRTLINEEMAQILREIG